ncbi:MAG: hypothetical protein CBE00_00765 [Planctomycetaceae bacterium TMED240]|nr:hypothetical protein [Rhodopirellula sp.]OUX08854.1 MAG: hypothetical protein CBE00_00765 [Planctomycetaceae bacterium TMED240]
MNTTRFPNIPFEKLTDSNPAVRAFGRRFYKDQTPLEYLAEFLLCFSSAKQTEAGEIGKGLPDLPEELHGDLKYVPESRLAVKLFSFFPSSKLETRHKTHVDRFKGMVKDLQSYIESESGESSERAVRVLQQLFSGFVGVAGERTWVTHSFIPASDFLLAREIDWRHTDAKKDHVEEWADAERHFSTSSHNFMARGGEVLFLQLWHVLQEAQREQTEQWLSGEYGYVDWATVRNQLADGLSHTLSAIDGPISQLGAVIEHTAQEDPAIKERRTSQAFGWVYQASWCEAALFAWELSNVVLSNQDALKKMRVLQDLCCLHVLRSVCFQAVRWVGERSSKGKKEFSGGYSWITVGANAGVGTDLGKASNASVSATEELLYGAVRSKVLPTLSGLTVDDSSLKRADDQGFKLFRSLGKQIGLIVPPKGPMRFTLPASLVETLVAVLLEPGERLPFDEFLQRLYRHFGIAAGAAQIEEALSTLSAGIRPAVPNDCAAWLEDELKRGGFLVPLSDATPLVKNPAKKKS